MRPRGPGRRRPRNACPLAPLGVHCHAYGNEADCTLCGIIDFGHPVTAVTLGLALPPDNFDTAEAAVAAQVDRCMRAGWTPQRGTQLHSVAVDHGLFEARVERAVKLRRQPAPKIDPPPF